MMQSIFKSVVIQSMSSLLNPGFFLLKIVYNTRISLP